MTDWGKVKRYYVTHPNASYADVAKKFGIGVTQVERHGRSDHWVQDRRDFVRKTTEKTIKKTAEKVVETESYALASRRNDYIDLAKKMMEKLNAAIDTIDTEDRDAVRKMVASVKDMQTILMLPTEEAPATDTDITVKVVAPGFDTESWGK